MPKITFVKFDDSVVEVEAAVGTSVMQAALDNGIDAIIAECGGACSCATCHVYVDDAWAAKVPAPNEVEADMIECVVGQEANSRLSCCMTMTEEMDGLVVRVPETQF